MDLLKGHDQREFELTRRRDLFGFFLLPLAACSRADFLDPRWRPAITELEKRIPPVMKEASVPGLSIAVIEEAKMIWRRGFGFRNSISKAPVDTDTIFEAASMSKPVFAYAVMKLSERGVLNLDTPLTKYTSERFLKDDPRLDLITARHVLSHTSGFQNWREETGGPLKIHFTPGEKWMYSGEGYSYLQSVVTHLSGQPIEEYMHENLFAPFGMTSSGYIWNDLMERQSARPHDAKGAPMDNKKSTAKDVARYASAGALKTTPMDYAKFLLEVMAPRPADKYRLTREGLQEMLRPQVKTGDQFGRSWTLGWQVTPLPNGDLIGHGGDNDGFHCYALMSLERKSGIVMMTNGENGASMLAKLLTGDLLTPLL